jgi:hypothetical protein
MTALFPSRRQEALQLADELLADIELVRLTPAEIARKALRLARLLDDSDAMTWLRFEVVGYPTGPGLPSDAWEAAGRSNRRFLNTEGQERAATTMLGQLQTNIDGALAQISAAADAPVSVTSANPNQFVTMPVGNAQERGAVRNFAGEQRALLDKVLGSIYDYVTSRYHELRFGSAVETSFEVVRARVDAAIASLVPEAPQMLAAAFENASSDNPEHWAGAAATCRRLLKASADALRPPGPPVDGHPMTDAHYRNRLIDWVNTRAKSETLADLITTDIEFLGRRLEAHDEGGHKGAHTTVSRFDAARIITGTYLLLGDVLSLAEEDAGPRDEHVGYTAGVEGEAPAIVVEEAARAEVAQPPK